MKLGQDMPHCRPTKLTKRAARITSSPTSSIIWLFNSSVCYAEELVPWAAATDLSSQSDMVQQPPSRRIQNCREGRVGTPPCVLQARSKCLRHIMQTLDIQYSSKGISNTLVLYKNAVSISACLRYALMTLTTAPCHILTRSYTMCKYKDHALRQAYDSSSERSSPRFSNSVNNSSAR